MLTTSGRSSIYLIASDDIRDGWVAALDRDFDVLHAKRTDSVRRAIRRADIVLASLMSDASPNDWLELGLAAGMNKPIIVATRRDDLPAWLAAPRVIVTPQPADPSDVSSFMATLEHRWSATERQAHNAPAAMTASWRDISERVRTGTGPVVYQAVLDALRTSGAILEAEALPTTAGPDAAMWVSDLPAAQNPLVVEFKSRVRSSADARRIVHQLRGYSRDLAAPIAVLVYRDGPKKLETAGEPVVAFRAADLVDRLSREPLGRVLAKEFAKGRLAL